MSRGGCGSGCTCLIEAGPGLRVAGAGTASSPLVVSGKVSADSGNGLTVGSDGGLFASSTGPSGQPGPGVPPGGARGAVLLKKSAADLDTVWVVPRLMAAGHLPVTIPANVATAGPFEIDFGADFDVVPRVFLQPNTLPGGTQFVHARYSNVTVRKVTNVMLYSRDVMGTTAKAMGIAWFAVAMGAPGPAGITLP